MNGILDVVPEVTTGEPPPQGYVAWCEWARVQTKARLKQTTCAKCGLWKFPQELSDTVIISPLYTETGQQIKARSSVCLECKDEP